ncbi:hypothetical protein HDV02_000326 [Globomyces sp. JEL0801]|nr:hypothetical protein HDV02_000326 [Globomyces sp. JEL0801]
MHPKHHQPAISNTHSKVAKLENDQILLETDIEDLKTKLFKQESQLNDINLALRDLNLKNSQLEQSLNDVLQAFPIDDSPLDLPVDIDLPSHFLSLHNLNPPTKMIDCTAISSNINVNSNIEFLNTLDKKDIIDSQKTLHENSMCSQTNNHLHRTQNNYTNDMNNSSNSYLGSNDDPQNTLETNIDNHSTNPERDMIHIDSRHLQQDISILDVSKQGNKESN